MTQQDLENLFSPYGRIITSRILCDNITGKSAPYVYHQRRTHTYVIRFFVACRCTYYPLAERKKVLRWCRGIFFFLVYRFFNEINRPQCGNVICPNIFEILWCSSSRTFKKFRWFRAVGWSFCGLNFFRFFLSIVNLKIP